MDKEYIDDIRHPKCDWCDVLLTDDNLYSFNGYKEYVGPICNDCKNDIVAGQIILELMHRER